MKLISVESKRTEDNPTARADFTCPLCGCRFPEAAGKTACRGCPLAFGCRLIKCPNCGYDLPRQASSAQQAAPLSKLRSGQSGKVADIYTPKLDQLQKLTAMGILPGTSISILQTYPTYVFQSGQTQFAVDKEIADAIYVRVDPDQSHSLKGKPARRRRWWGGQH
jgi:Fe2+ transport system protein FeoA